MPQCFGGHCSLHEIKFALVAGKNLKYQWLLSRTPAMPREIKAEYLKKAAEPGYKVDDLSWPKQD
jgi:apolipoprotein D and lipocalin family protein